MFGYKIQVEKVLEDQEKMLSEQIDDVIKLMDENINELEKLVVKFEALSKMES